MNPIYFDHNATTPLDPRSLEEMKVYLTTNFGNPSSIHQIGRKARVRLDDYREKVAKLLKCKSHEIIFTSGGTESNNLALFGVSRMLLRESKRNVVIVSSIEHHAVLHCAKYLELDGSFQVIYIPVDSDGRVSLKDLKDQLELNKGRIALVSIMAANNETGAHQPFTAIGDLCKEHGVLFHTDTAQWIGKEAFDGIQFFNADLVSICAHKFNGPKGVGILYAKSPLHPDPILFGGGHENDRRAGTENLANIAGMAVALELVTPSPFLNDQRRHQNWINQLRTSIITIPGIKVWTPEKGSLPNTLMFSFDSQDAISIIAALDLEGICVSSGSACSVGSLLPSHVLEAQGASKLEASSAVRISIGNSNTEEELSRGLEIIPSVLRRLL
jgi:cysteine desulfurase